MQDMFRVLMFSFVSVAFLFIISKLAGKKQIAQLNFIDYVLAISVGSIAAEMATDLDDTPFYLYLVAMGIFLLFDITITFLERKGTRIKNFLKGRPISIIYDGKINYANLKRSKLDVNDLIMLAREAGYFDVNDIAYAIYENNGALSILPKGNQKPTVAEDFNIEIKRPKLPIYLVIDGKVSYSNLSAVNKSEEWLMKRIKIKSKKELKSYILISFDEENNKLIFHEKSS